MIVISDDDTLEIECTVTGAPSALVAGDITASVQKQDGEASETTGAATIAVTSSTVFTATFAKTIWSVGKWIMRARVVDGAEEQIVAKEHIQVEPSHI